MPTDAPRASARHSGSAWIKNAGQKLANPGMLSVERGSGADTDLWRGSYCEWRQQRVICEVVRTAKILETLPHAEYLLGRWDRSGVLVSGAGCVLRLRRLSSTSLSPEGTGW